MQLNDACLSTSAAMAAIIALTAPVVADVTFIDRAEQTGSATVTYGRGAARVCPPGGQHRS